MRRVVLVVLVTVAMAFTGAACGGGDDGIATPTDPVLAQGQQVYRSYCASCHGSKGGGASGPKLAGVVEVEFPDIADHIAIIADGKGGGMPAFKDRLTAEQIEAVARYERETL